MIAVNRRRYMGGASADEVIMTSTSNPEVMAICYAQGWAAHSDYMTKSEAEAVTNIGTAFRGENIISFNEFQYFISVSSLSENAFRGCSSLSTIVLPSTLNKIYNHVFYNCTSLNSINLENVTSIGNLALYRTSIVSVNISSCTSLGIGAFCECYKLQDVGSISNIVSIANGNNGTFASSKLSGVFIFTSFTGTTIPQAIFHSCSLVTDAQFPSSNYTSIGANAFQNAGIQSFAVREGCTTLNNHSLSGQNWRFIDLPSTLTTWNGFAMWQNTNQKAIVSRATTPPSINNTTGSQKSFDGIPTTCKIYVPQASIPLYEAAAGWDRFAGRFLPIEGTWYETHREIDPNDE